MGFPDVSRHQNRRATAFIAAAMKNTSRHCHQVGCSGSVNSAPGFSVVQGFVRSVVGMGLDKGAETGLWQGLGGDAPACSRTAETATRD